MFEILTSETHSPYPVIAHCTQGKDRTEVVILMVLLCLRATNFKRSTPEERIPISAISYDYALTNEGLQRVREKMIQETISDAALSPSFVDIDPEFIPAVVRYINEKYGGIHGYIAYLGLDPEVVIEKIQRDLLVESS